MKTLWQEFIQTIRLFKTILDEAKTDKELEEKPETRGEMIANTSTHALGLVLGLVAFGLLLKAALAQGSALVLFSYTLFGISIIFLYFSSTMYHLTQNPETKEIFRITDHAGIYLLIAGTYTPFSLIAMPSPTGEIIFTVIWILAIVGILFKTKYVGKFDSLSTLLYVLMGWIVLFALGELIEAMAMGALLWLIIGGIIYTGGVAFYLWEKLPFNHAIWHLFVLGGTVSHFIAIYYYV
jgi:hemolysin III